MFNAEISEPKSIVSNLAHQHLIAPRKFPLYLPSCFFLSIAAAFATAERMFERTERRQVSKSVPL
jgi:hypothetical protein